MVLLESGDRNMENFKLVKIGDQVRLKKANYNIENSSGVSILGWFSENNASIWVNYLRGVNMSYLSELGLRYIRVEEKTEINPDHITLYGIDKTGDEQLLGWIEEKHKNKIKDVIWNYMKGELEPEIIKEDDQDGFEDEDPVDVDQLEQLSLF